MCIRCKQYSRESGKSQYGKVILIPGNRYRCDRALSERESDAAGNREDEKTRNEVLRLNLYHSSPEWSSAPTSTCFPGNRVFCARSSCKYLGDMIQYKRKHIIPAEDPQRKDGVRQTGTLLRIR